MIMYAKHISFWSSRELPQVITTLRVIKIDACPHQIRCIRQRKYCWLHLIIHLSLFVNSKIEQINESVWSWYKCFFGVRKYSSCIFWKRDENMIVHELNQKSVHTHAFWLFPKVKFDLPIKIQIFAYYFGSRY